jgi:nitrilase
MKRVAAIQMASGPNVSANLTESARLVLRAVEAGAELVVLPENFAMMGMTEEDKLGIQETEGGGPIQTFVSELAKKHRVWIVAGTIPITASDEQHVRSSCLVYNELGEMQARYDKVHLFDVHLEENKETYNESTTIEAGNNTVVIDTPFGKLGLAICYDLRFPELFRGMVDDGVQLIAIPSAFTAITGNAHWETLVKARAIENLCYVIAADQGGYHINSRETHGDSMVVDPWGNVLDRLPRGSGFVTADIDLSMVENTRRNFPALKHRKIPCNLKP